MKCKSFTFCCFACSTQRPAWASEVSTELRRDAQKQLSLTEVNLRPGRGLFHFYGFPEIDETPTRSAGVLCIAVPRHFLHLRC